MDDSKRYYWLKLKEDFFEDDTVKFLREQPNGDEYCIFYLILCLKSLKTNGRLVRLVGDTFIPYNTRALSELTGVREEVVIIALKLLLEYGVIKKLDTGELYIQQVEEMVGSETYGAKRKRVRRLKAANKLVEEKIKTDIQQLENDVKITPFENNQKKAKNVKITLFEEKLTGVNSENGKISHECPIDIELEKEKELEKELDLEIEKKKKGRKKKEKSYDEVLDEKEVTGDLREVFLEFIKARKMNGKKMTSYALSLAVNKVRRLSNNEEEQIAIVEQSIISGWSGLFPLKESVGGQSSGRGVVKQDRLYEPRDGEDITYQKMFDLWRKYVRVSVPQTEEQVEACKRLLADIGEDGVARLIVSLAMRSKHGFLPANLTNINDFVGLSANAAVVQAFYDKNWKYWERLQKAAALGKEVWEVT